MIEIGRGMDGIMHRGSSTNDYTKDRRNIWILNNRAKTTFIGYGFINIPQKL